MTNELIFSITILLDLFLLLIATRYGKNWIFVLIVANLIMVQLLAVKNFLLFGMVANVATLFYAAIYLGTDILTEHWGKEEGYKSIRYAFLAIIFVIGAGFLSRLLVPFNGNETSDAVDVLFDAVPRIVFASLFAYVISQHLDIWLYHKIHEKTGGGYLWLRNNGSTLVSQLVDTIIFFTVAFYGVIPYLTELILTAYIIKIGIALIDTPFIYLSYRVLGKTLPSGMKEVRDPGAV